MSSIINSLLIGSNGQQKQVECDMLNEDTTVEDK